MWTRVAPPPHAGSDIIYGRWFPVFRVWIFRFHTVCVCAVCVCAWVCERVSSVVVTVPSSDTVTALHRRQAPCSYMQVTVAAPQSLASNDRKPRDQASQRGRVSACEERTETGEKRLGEEPPPLPWAAAQVPLPPRGGGGEARDGTGRRGCWSRGSIYCPDSAVIAVIFMNSCDIRTWHDNSFRVLIESCCWLSDSLLSSSSDSLDRSCTE